MASRRALVTGAGRGIGRAVVLSLIKDGYDVVGVSRTHSELAEVAATVVARQIPGDGKFLPHVTDVRDSHSVARLMAEEGSDGLNLMVCCAGVARLGRVAATTPDDFCEMTMTNLIAPFNCLYHARVALARTKGTALFLVSRAARTTYPNAVGYGASKAGLIYMIGAAARDLAADGIRIIGLSPGAVSTPMRAALFPDENPNELLQPEDVAEAVISLLDPRLAHISGTVVDQPW